jgi:hypothetical protein
MKYLFMILIPFYSTRSVSQSFEYLKPVSDYQTTGSGETFGEGVYLSGGLSGKNETHFF